MEIRDVLTNIKKYDAWDYKNYPLRKDEADAIIENYKEPCEDAVSRAELEKCFTVDMTDISIAECLALIIKRVKALPSVQPKPKTDVLDKIKAEIEQNAYPIVHGCNNHELGMTLYGILQIIDKYKADMRGNE